MRVTESCQVLNGRLLSDSPLLLPLVLSVSISDSMIVRVVPASDIDPTCHITVIDSQCESSFVWVHVTSNKQFVPTLSQARTKHYLTGGPGVHVAEQGMRRA